MVTSAHSLLLLYCGVGSLQHYYLFFTKSISTLPMKKLFQKQKQSKVSKDFSEVFTSIFKTPFSSIDFVRQPEPPNSKQTIPTPLYQRLATHGAHIHAISLPVFQQSTNQSIIPSPTDDQHPATHEVGPLPNPHSPPATNTPTRSNSFHASSQISTATLSSTAPPRSNSPVSTIVSKLGRVHDLERIKPSAVGILSSLEPPRTDGALTSGARSYTDERHTHSQVSISESGHGPIHVEKEKRRGFWNVRDKEKEREKEREREREREIQLKRERQERDHRDNRGKEPLRREDESQGELTRMIGRSLSGFSSQHRKCNFFWTGYLTATASQDWALMLEVCERASATEANAKEAVRALRREFKSVHSHSLS